MLYDYLGKTDIKVSKICLGTMTWGYQNTYEDAEQQMTYALDHGVNFWDTAELYAVPPTEETYGKTEEIIGQYLTANPGVREKIILASKIAGPGLPYAREGRPGISMSDINEAVEGSLRRLNTDYIDLYQIHWPARTVPVFGLLDFKPEWMEQDDHIEEVLTNMSKLVEQGKVRHIGLSNETAWGTMRFLHLAEKMGLERMVSVQNVYSLVTRHYDVAMAEVSYREEVGLLAYSPLAGGVLTGKYRNGAQPAGARLSEWGKDRYARYSGNDVFTAVDEYYEIATKHGLSLTQMSLAWVNQKPWLTSNIIGATNMDQLKENIDSINVTLSPEIIREIDDVHGKYRNPTAQTSVERVENRKK